MCGRNKLYFREIALKSTQSCKRINYISMKLLPAMEEIANNILENIFVFLIVLGSRGHNLVT